MRLNEIEYLRPILFIQLFFVHAFTIYTETSWKIPTGIESVGLYDWIARISYSCMLELFTFISGYVFYFVSNRKAFSFGELFMSKFKRLLIPSILFSILYYLLLMERKVLNFQLIYEIICGEGHLWYLPMLFGCFLLLYFIKDVKKPCCFLFIALIISVFSRCPNIFRISQIAYYFFFFYLGVNICRYRESIILYILRGRVFIFISVLLILSLTLLLPLNIRFKSYIVDTWLTGYFVSALTRFINIIYSSIGIAFWYSISVHISQMVTRVPECIKHFNILSMGVYVFHQFILMFLYYYTSLPDICGSYLLPWIAIGLALPTSVMLSYIFRLSKIGKLLI